METGTEHGDRSLLFENGGAVINSENRALNFGVWLQRLKRFPGPYVKIGEWAVESVWEEESQSEHRVEMNDRGKDVMSDRVWERYLGFIIFGRVR